MACPLPQRAKTTFQCGRHLRCHKLVIARAQFEIFLASFDFQIQKQVIADIVKIRRILLKKIFSKDMNCRRMLETLL
jgi:hypothetical protein